MTRRSWLMNERAICSDWVHTEVAYLRLRQWRQEGVALIPILRGKGTKQALRKEKRWQPIAFKELQLLEGGKEYEGQVLPRRRLPSRGRSAALPPHRRAGRCVSRC